MAKQTAGYLGGFHGTLGPAIGYMWNGKWCVRSRPTAVRNPRTPEQVAQREMFKREVQLAADLRDAVVDCLTTQAREVGMTSYNLFVSVNQPAFSLVAGVFTVDWRQLRLSMGDVPPVEAPTMTLAEDNILEITYETGNGYSHDQVFAVVYAPGLNYSMKSNPAFRRDRHIAIALPDQMASEELQVWLMVQDPEGQWSESVWVPGGEECGMRDEELEEHAEGAVSVACETPAGQSDRGPVAAEAAKAPPE